MAEIKEKKVSQENQTPDPYELVSYTPFYDGHEYKDDIVANINGKEFILKRGQTHMIPRYVRDSVVDKERQSAKANDMKLAMQEAFARSSRNI